MDIQVLASGSTGNAYKIDDGETAVLLEAGLPFRKLRQALDFKVSELSGVLCSHGHADHSHSLKDLMRAGIDVYALQTVFDALGLSGHRARPIEANKCFSVGSWAAMPFKGEHDVDSLGFLLASKTGERLVYLTDSAYSRYRFESVNYWMLEINYDAETIKQNLADGVIDREHYKRVIRSHCSLETALELLKANDLSRTVEIIAIHLSQENANEARIKRALQETTGKVVRIA